MIGRIWADRSNQINMRCFLWMKLMIGFLGRNRMTSFGSVLQDSDYALTMDSASLSTCQMVVPFGNCHHRFKTNFCCYLNDKIFELNICKFHSSVISDLGNGKWQVEMGKVLRFFLRISLALALPATTTILRIHPSCPKIAINHVWSLLEINND